MIQCKLLDQYFVNKVALEKKKRKVNQILNPIFMK